MKTKTVWEYWGKARSNGKCYWLGDPSGKVAFSPYADLRWVNFQDLEVRPYEALRGTRGFIIGDSDE